MNASLHFGLAQITSGNQISKNLELIENYASQTKKQNGQVLFLPENALWMGDSQDIPQVAQHILQDQIVLKLQNIAKTLSLHLHVGSFPQWVASENKSYNTSLWINSEGEILSSYRKIHLFDVTTPQGDVYRESDQFLAGTDLSIVQALSFNVGQSICFDVRFPEHYRHLAQKGADLLLVPAAFTQETGQAHWHVLLRARAIENFSFLIAAAQVGTHATGRKTFGHSLVIDPWGHIVFDAGKDPGLYMSSIPYSNRQALLRQQFQATQFI